ncbi:MAG TPA: hypothetical protein VFV37_00245 [Luteibaculaceae bacterium]|nr:hypothetical protein [Luteibaculaceae bacterium]
MRFIVAILSLTLLTGCSDDPIPKPTAYFRIALPEKQYRFIDTLQANYAFDLPQYARAIPSPDMRPGDRYWYNIYFPQFMGEIYLTYKDIDSKQPLPILLEDLHKTAYGHSSRADQIVMRTFEFPERKTYGVVYEVYGDVASQVQFCLTDSTRRFLRGSLYFACPPNKDSLAPVVKFIKADIDRLIQSFNWK